MLFMIFDFYYSFVIWLFFMFILIQVINKQVLYEIKVFRIIKGYNVIVIIINNLFFIYLMWFVRKDVDYIIVW